MAEVRTNGISYSLIRHDPKGERDVEGANFITFSSRIDDPEALISARLIVVDMMGNAKWYFFDPSTTWRQTVIDLAKPDGSSSQFDWSTINYVEFELAFSEEGSWSFWVNDIWTDRSFECMSPSSP